MSLPRQAADILTGNIPETGQFNRQFNALAARMNNGLDRENLPADCIGSDELEDQAAWKFVLYTGLELGEAYYDAITTGYEGVDYDLYHGGWVTHSTVPQLACQEGMLHVEFGCWAWHEAPATVTVDDIYYQFRLVIPGLGVIAELDRVYTHMQTIQIVADLPVPTGTHQVQIQWRTPSPQTGGSTSARFFWWSGGSCLLLNRYR